MAEVKWIKLATGLPDNKKIKQIRKLPDGDTIALMWVFMMCLAGNTDENGLVYFTPEIPYTDEMLADEFNMDVNTIRLGLQTFERFGMIEVINDVICLSAWEKWQSVDKLSEIREYNRIAKQKSRAKQKMLADKNVNDMSMTCQLCQDTEEEIEEEKEIEIEIEEEGRTRTDYQYIADLFNRLCPSFPMIKALSDARKKAIKARLKTYSVEDFEALFLKAEASSFLKGGNDRNWSATFDWLIKDANMAKVLDGNYDNRSGSKQPINKKAQELDEFYAMASDWANGGE